MILPLSLFCVENIVCLSHGVQVAGVIWRVATRIVAGVGDLVRRTGDTQSHVGYSVAGRSGGQMTLCVICTMHEETRSVCFLVEPQNQGLRTIVTISPDLTSKPVATVSPGLTSKPVTMVSPSLVSKPVASSFPV
jgi:hypothetical protein